MDNIKRIGDCDRTDDGLIRLREGDVDGKLMTAQVQSHGGELVVTFYCDGHRRRFLVDAHGTYLADFGGRAVVLAANNKYHSALSAI